MVRRFFNKIKKAVYALGHPVTRRALKFGAAPSLEHEKIIRSLGLVRSVVDVGANVGQFALLSLRLFPEVRIHSFEPIPEVANTFEAVMKGLDQVTLHRVALGAETGESKINISARADSSSLLKNKMQDSIFPGTQTVGQYMVKIDRLDNLLQPSDIEGLSLLKIDVQGYESEVLKGCETRLPLFDWIFCELSFEELYAGQPMAHEIISWLGERNFVLDGVYMTKGSYGADGKAIQGDFLFQRMG